MVGNSGAEMAISEDEAESPDAAEDGALEKARARLLAQLGDRLVQPAVPPSDAPVEPSEASSFKLLSRAEAERQRQEMRNNKPQKENVTCASVSTSDISYSFTAAYVVDTRRDDAVHPHRDVRRLCAA